MADRKAQQKYYPPDWQPEHGSLNKYHGSHPLRDRARKLKDGIMIIRFELPFNVWCAGCGNHAGMGVRYNAEKTQVGKYYTTPIFRFRMKCTMCENKFEIETDPKNFDYKVVAGASKQNHTATPSEGDVHSLPGESEAERLSKDPMFRLEHGVRDQQKAKEALPEIQQLQKLQESMKDDFAVNQRLRKRFREEKKAAKEVEDEKKVFAKRVGLYIPAAPLDKKDESTAKKIKFAAQAPRSLKQKERGVRSTRILSSAAGEGQTQPRSSLMTTVLASRPGGGVVTGGKDGGQEGPSLSSLRSKLGVVGVSKPHKS